VTGALQLDVGSQTFLLSTGDSAWFDASAAHSYNNPTPATTHFTMVVLGP
jgi:quercetin dioxygenase-like cupin family protein